jgi:hypothetical protein
VWLAAPVAGWTLSGGLWRALARAGVPALRGGRGATDSIRGALPGTGSLSGDLAMLARQQADTLSRQEVIETLRGILTEART